MRLNTDGSYDMSFDGDGKVTFDLTGTDDYAHGVDVQADNKLLIAGYTVNATNDMFVMRLQASGALDFSFDSDGRREIDLGSDERGNTVIAQTDGKILLGGSTGNPFGVAVKLAVAKINSDGTLDNNFAGTGVGTYAHGTGSHSGEDIALRQMERS